MSNPVDAWFAAELAKSNAREPTHEPGLLLGALVWGPKYIERFERLCLASLLAPANLAALRAMNARLVVFTEPETLITLWRVLELAELGGIKTQIYPIPTEVTRHVKGGPHKYLPLAAVQNLVVQWAARRGMAVHLACPDHGYSDRYFEAMAEKGANHDAIAHGAISADEDGAMPELEPYRQGRTLAIPARKLGDLAFRHLHPQMVDSLNAPKDSPAWAALERRWPKAPADRLPLSQTVIWLGRDAIHFHGPIYNPVWMSARLCRVAPVLYPVTLDAEVANLLPDDFHIPGPDDDMVLVEFSDKEKGHPGKVPDLENWVDVSWIQMNYDSAYLSLIRRRTLIPIEPNADGLADTEIDARHAELIEAIERGKFKAMEKYFAMTNRQQRPFLRS